MIYGIIICFGDSLTYGSRDEYGLSFPNKIGMMLGTKQLWTSINLGVPGETTADMLRRSYREVKLYPEAKEIILLAGTNDAKDNVPIEVFKENYMSIIKDFIILGKRVYVCTIPLKKGFGSPGYLKNINNLIKEYNKFIRDFSPKQILIELEDLPKEYFIDGIHFNHKGNIEVARRIVEKIKEVR